MCLFVPSLDFFHRLMPWNFEHNEGIASLILWKSNMQFENLFTARAFFPFREIVTQMELNPLGLADY